MNPHVSVITLGVRDLVRARRFYSDGLGPPRGILRHAEEVSGNVSRTCRSSGSTR
jgi:hypothetical protein